uniref:Uncharacterized protein n=1 Tax=Davidia involucrata TaxID=16924 RepID=A0A5B7AZB3_DAVIN
MLQTQSNPSPGQRPKTTTLLHLEASNVTSTIPKKMLYKANTTTTKFPEKMGATAPVEVGTRGTVGSLVMKEIEYFSKLELERRGSARKPQGHVVNLASSSGNSWPSFGFLIMTWRRKKRRSSTGFRPSICSVVEVEDSHQLNGIPGFTYRNLKADVKKFEV